MTLVAGSPVEGTLKVGVIRDKKPITVNIVVLLKAATAEFAESGNWRDE